METSGSTAQRNVYHEELSEDAYTHSLKRLSLVDRWTLSSIDLLARVNGTLARMRLMPIGRECNGENKTLERYIMFESSVISIIMEYVSVSMCVCVYMVDCYGRVRRVQC